MTEQQRHTALTEEWGRLREEWPALADWTLRVNGRLTRTAGRCMFAPRRLEVARWHLERSDWPDVVNTLRHEVAHALAPRNAGHGWAWKAWAIKVGARPSRCYSAAVAAHAPARQRPTKYLQVCMKCGQSWPRRRRTPRGRTYSHRVCGGAIELVKVNNG